MEFSHIFILTTNPLAIYGADYKACADDIVDLTQVETVLAQVGYQNGDDDGTVGSHFTLVTPEVFAQTQLDARCFVHVCSGVTTTPEEYRKQRKKVRLAKRRHVKRRLMLDESSEEF